MSKLGKFFDDGQQDVTEIWIGSFVSLSSPGINFHHRSLKKTLHFWTFVLSSATKIYFGGKLCGIWALLLAKHFLSS